MKIGIVGTPDMPARRIRIEWWQGGENQGVLSQAILPDSSPRDVEFILRDLANFVEKKRQPVRGLQ